MRGIEGKVTLITGGIRGIGKGIAKRFVEEGAQVIVTGSKDVENARKTVEEYSKLGKIESYMADLSDAAAIDKMIDDVVKKYGRIDILVNNAGVSLDGLLLMAKVQDFDRTLETNLRGAYFCTKEASRMMLRQRYGRIVNISSVVGVRGNAGQTAYAASKAGLLGFTKAAAKELAAKGITVNAVAPGMIDTDMTCVLPEAVREGMLASIPAGRAGTAEEVAQAVAFFAAPEAAYITGQTLCVDGGMAV